MDTAWRALDRVGCLPADPDADRLSWPVCEGGDLLAALGAIWRDSAQRAKAASRLHRERIADRLDRWRAQGARLTWGLSGETGRRLNDWLGPRIAWWPATAATGSAPAMAAPGSPAPCRERLVGLVSSRQGQDLAAHRLWLSALRAACMHLDPARDLLVTARSMSTQRLAQPAGELFGLRVLDVTIGGDSGKSARPWGDRLLRGEIEAVSEKLRLVLSPRCGADASLPPELKELPAADRAVFGLSDRLIVLAARPAGNVHRLVDHRLAAEEFPAASVYLALGGELVPRTLAKPWMDRGAVGWCLLDSSDDTLAATVPPPWWAVDGAPRRAAPVRRLPPANAWPLLSHWTRRRGGPWPDEQESDYLDNLILDRRGTDHSAFAALWRIVQTRRLIAAGSLIRGHAPMVCWTEVPLAELPQLRSFRSHLSRWDFELYGIAIDRDWLQQRGARPVRYGDEPLWEALPQEERPFFQKRYSQTPSGHHIDWSVEREWRHPGDVLLNEVPEHAAVLFVPNLSHARQIACVSPWPVIVLDGD